MMRTKLVRLAAILAGLAVTTSGCPSDNSSPSTPKDNRLPGCSDSHHRESPCPHASRLAA